MTHQLEEEGYSSSNSTYPFIDSSLPAEETTNQSVFPSMDDHAQDVQCKEATVENDVICSSSGAGFSEACALVVGSASLADVYRMQGIRWKFCQRCGINNQQDEPQDGFESELVLGADHCIMCLAKKQQQEMIKDCHSDDDDDDGGDDGSGSGVMSDIDGSCVAEALLLENHATKSSSASADKNDT